MSSGEGQGWVSEEDRPKWFIGGRIFSQRRFVKGGEARQDKSKAASWLCVTFCVLNFYLGILTFCDIFDRRVFHWRLCPGSYCGGSGGNHSDHSWRGRSLS